jgi:sulfite exporter TauE/SafE
MTPLEFFAIFGIGLLSSIHCLQMCGPIVLTYSLPLAKKPNWRALVRAHAEYNAGRILTYSILGAVAGAAGGTVTVLTSLAGLANGARILAGAAMLIAALAIAGAIPNAGLIQIQTGTRGSWFATAVGRQIRSRSTFRLGLLLGLLPCGLVYAALLKAVETGTAVGGALTMLAFGSGTAGTLATVGVASSLAGLRLGRWSNVISAASIALMGAFLLWRGLSGAPAIGHMGHVHHG